MLLFAISLVVVLTIIAAMSIGVLLGRKPISGSCGGVGAALGQDNYTCEICGDDPNKCDEQSDGGNVASKTSQLAYEADR